MLMITILYSYLSIGQNQGNNSMFYVLMIGWSVLTTIFACLLFATVLNLQNKTEGKEALERMYGMVFVGVFFNLLTVIPQAALHYFTKGLG